MKHLVCEACWIEIFNTEIIQKFWANESYDFCYNATWARIAQSAQGGCNWCIFLASVLPSPGTSEWPSSWTQTTDLFISLDEANLMENASPRGLNLCQIDFGTEAFGRDWHVELDLFVDATEDSAGIVTAHPLQRKVNSEEAYSQIKQWLEQCNKHADCGGLTSYTDLPSRLIEVAPADSPEVPRLRSTTGLKGSYLTLSYSWGSNQSYVLTTENLDASMSALEINMLPQTILDAIKVSQTLGFKYLWVDALCILQDLHKAAARQDMDHELAMMDQVYKNAEMTIVAACVPSVRNSFLKDRSGPVQSCLDIPCRLGPGKFFVVHIQEHIMYNDLSEPINARAWTFQEQLLSPRLLIYASHTLQWQCRTLTCNLGGSYHAPSPSAAPRLPSVQKLLSRDLEEKLRRDQRDSDIPHHILQHWLRIARSYSIRKSTLPSDKLPALSALAISYESVFGPEYLAGIWARSAVQQLCWCHQDTRQFFTRPMQYRAPSWSWAALDGPVYFPSYLENNDNSVCVPYHRFRIVEWQTRLKAVGLPYGEVTAGKLIVTTVLRDATFEPSSFPTIRFHTVQGSESDDVKADPSSVDFGQSEIARGSSDTAEDNFNRPVRCLAMYHSNGPGSTRIDGLMLVESSENKGFFRRIGSCSANVSAFEGHPLETVNIV